jgi:hypothetical protein
MLTVAMNGGQTSGKRDRHDGPLVTALATGEAANWTLCEVVPGLRRLAIMANVGAPVAILDASEAEAAFPRMDALAASQAARQPNVQIGVRTE